MWCCMKCVCVGVCVVCVYFLCVHGCFCVWGFVCVFVFVWVGGFVWVWCGMMFVCARVRCACGCGGFSFRCVGTICVCFSACV